MKWMREVEMTWTEPRACLTVDWDLSSREEDDVFEKELQYSTSAAKDWMAAFGRSRLPADTCEKKKGSLSGWYSRRDKGHAKQNTNKSSLKRLPLMHAEANLYDESDKEEHYSRTHDEVGQLLQECAKIALSEDLVGKESASSSPPTSPVDATDEEGSTHMSLASIQGGYRRVVTQADILNICSTLELKPYQVVGVNWLLLLYENKVSGVLADEMGLGKMVQTIAFLPLLKSFETTDEQANGPHLVVVPASVLNNWKRELSWIAPTLRVVMYHGGKEHRRAMEDTLTRDDFDIMLTTYAYFERVTSQDERAFLRSFQFGYMILDEVHSIQNSNTSRFKRLTALRARTRLDDLLSFFDGSEAKKCENVRKILAPFILRREKKYVLSQLVPKTLSVELIQVTDEERKAYTNILESVIKRIELVATLKEAVKEEQKMNKSREHKVRELMG
ncbi:hypothetical protein PsorP6_010598 [Peronosclerospora sorghi]|uniref:Uncharacterized protein n=1 Tax=Peronosclerospora sorghi TaxID=230839 RepID=A0ACC0VW17_9STRA|nr:hypothetical protein PsorP6_010598 [Peronosclerospora sorghi]